MSRRWAALAGVVAAAAGLAVAELVAAWVAPASSPVLAAGAAVVDTVPGWLKDLAISWFGTADKAVLLGTMGVVLAAGAVLAGRLELRRPPWGAVLLAAVGVVGALVATRRPGASATWALPSLVGVGLGVVLLRAFIGRLRVGSTAPSHPDGDGALDRRAFLWLTGATAAGALLAVVASRVVGAGARAVQAVRETLRLPTAATAARAVPAGADLGVVGLATYLTPNETFYRIDTALRVPTVDPATWSLRVHGLVDRPFELTWAELLDLPLVEHHVTLACVSNWVGGDLIGNALWLGYPVRELLARAGPHAGADMVLSRSIDGFTAGTPLDVLLEPDRECLLAIGMNGEPLPVEHGFPARLVVPGLYGYVSATKWVTELKVTRFADDVAYWTPRGWSERGPVKLQSRIDVPRQDEAVSPGADGFVTVAGVAWAQHTGVSGVEVQVDDGPWEVATLADTVGPDTWRQWRFAWDAAAAGRGQHTLRVRATDADGAVQTADEAPPAPDGATGRHTISVAV
ncbi:oxidoreductase molybdopterin binding protein [Xylanimonas cellulosilytica DSM 15894]|uniref:Oxidoreductase molybdopterin binding protein n=1 Tax=Xylanimonas cellulosilytica (strain DSM 15894 / JCM 12276 / CECT 5975 / KCTC 9989 / LMG 20990 / NBRC 107835 / XIL07) TaxID=446471 RepID=D1BRG4_XYLCX|nr:molybdopterin-dependent oxidoreductase [Xylanimonas cellulosilytica]ACZ30419.1 oxidoreductase molybdopterin binding protein [Xylanimonas cellulosilytica DSM 15894]